jgi:hypothetical protein
MDTIMEVAKTVIEFVVGMIIGLGGIVTLFLLTLSVTIFSIICLWKCFVKMGEPGWKSIIPIYNTWTLCKLTWGSGLIILTWLIPYIRPIFISITYWKMYSRFGKGLLFNIFGLFFQPITTAICAFDKSTYSNKIA